MTRVPKPIQNAVGALLLTFIFVAPAFADGELINVDADEVAIKGYDPVAYFTEERPVKGKPEFEYVWQDARWRFSNARHQELFASNPDRYAPRYGGFCAGGMALGLVAPIDPEAWVIVDGKLYLNYSKRGRDHLAADPEPKIARADANWDRLGNQH